MNILAAIKREERKLEKQLGKLQKQLEGVRAAGKALGNSAGRELSGIKKRVLSEAGRAKIAKAAKKRWAKVRAEPKKGREIIWKSEVKTIVPCLGCSLSPDKRGGFNGSMQHHLTVVLKGGVYGRTEKNETFSHREGRHLGSLEGRAVHACDWARLLQAHPTNNTSREEPTCPPSLNAQEKL